MDPLSVISGTIGIAGAAIQTITVLVNEISAIKNAPENMKRVRSELSVVESLLRDISQGLQDSRLSSIPNDVKSTLQKAIFSCKDACDQFRAKLQKWTRHSGSKMDWRDRARVGLFSESAIQDLNSQLHISIDIMGAVIGAGAVFSISQAGKQSGRMPAETRNKLQSMESKLSQGIQDTDKRVRNVSMELESLSRSSQSRSEADRQAWLEEFQKLQNQLTALGQSREIRKSLYGKSRHLQSVQKFSNIHSDETGQLMVGIFGTDPNPRVYQDFRNITATRSGRGMIGVIGGHVDVNEFFSRKVE
ncbi:hypothetical protein N7478_010813 [Penicillium angulare]|uniref:uncharacterized protein n=1 Tax=Penicillium angulare TaxID=116970 RepID=UPI0025412455|nr:uncharacterized protein N7478_010813 [Penicillium angulare]KAJ5263208.1 hypothetical protein N7478_010813 [Penicillium angulare]